MRETQEQRVRRKRKTQTERKEIQKDTKESWCEIKMNEHLVFF